MTPAIQVIIDEEIIEEFKGKIFWSNVERFVPGAVSYYDGIVWIVEEGGGMFEVGPKGVFQYDEEFSEWLKIHRPEVFL